MKNILTRFLSRTTILLAIGLPFTPAAFAQVIPKTTMNACGLGVKKDLCIVEICSVAGCLNCSKTSTYVSCTVLPK